MFKTAAIISGGNVFDCQFTSSFYTGNKRTVSVEQWSILCGMYDDPNVIILKTINSIHLLHFTFSLSSENYFTVVHMHFNGIHSMLFYRS